VCDVCLRHTSEFDEPSGGFYAVDCLSPLEDVGCSSMAPLPSSVHASAFM
jgi:hypothetical protein